MHIRMNTPEALVIDMTGTKTQVIIATLTSVGMVLGLGSLVAGQWPLGLGILAIVAVLVTLWRRDRRGKWRLRLVRRAGTVTLAHGGTKEVLPLSALADAQIEPAPPVPGKPSASRAQVILHFAADTGRAPLTLTQDARPLPASDAVRLARVITDWLARYRQMT